MADETMATAATSSFEDKKEEARATGTPPLDPMTEREALLTLGRFMLLAVDQTAWKGHGRDHLTERELAALALVERMREGAMAPEECDPCFCRRAVPGMWTSGYSSDPATAGERVRHGGKQCTEYMPAAPLRAALVGRDEAIRQIHEDSLAAVRAERELRRIAEEALNRRDRELESATRESDRREALLTLYRVKLAVDGLNDRPWDSVAHYAAAAALDAAGEKPLPVDSYESLVILRELVDCAVEALAELEKGTATPGAAVAEPADEPPPSASQEPTT